MVARSSLGASSVSVRPPNAAQFNRWQDYAEALSAYFGALSRAQEGVQPQAVQLIHIDTTGDLARVVANGLLVYDPIRRGVMVSVDGEWLPLYAGIAYGGMRSGAGAAPAADITDVWRQIVGYTEQLPTEDMIFDPVTDSFQFLRDGLYQVNLQISLQHNNSGQPRELDVRVTNTVTLASTRGIRIATGSGDRTTTYTQSLQVLVGPDGLSQPYIVEVSAPIGDYTSVEYIGLSLQAARINYAF